MSMTKKDLIAALAGVPDNAILIADLGDGESRCVQAVQFDPTLLPDTKSPQFIIHAPEI